MKKKSRIHSTFLFEETVKCYINNDILNKKMKLHAILEHWDSSLVTSSASVSLAI